MLIRCCPTVYDVLPALNHHWVIISYWLGDYSVCMHVVMVMMARGDKSVTWMGNIRYIPGNTRHWTNVGLMLGQRRRRWANIKLTLVQCLALMGYRPRHQRVAASGHKGCWPHGGGGGVQLFPDRKVLLPSRATTRSWKTVAECWHSVCDAGPTLSYCFRDGIRCLCVLAYKVQPLRWPR